MRGESVEGSVPPYNTPMAEILVIVPTFNERGNIGVLLERIFALPLPLHVLVVDDGSPDGTAEVVRIVQRKVGTDRLFLRERRGGKAGRGSACLEGFAFARERGYQAVIEMDADLSHDPRDIPRFLEALQGADVVIGSKYCPGGRVEGWEWYRRCLSRMANLYAHLILQMSVRDYTNGYRCYSTRAIALLPNLPIEGSGFTVIPQMSYLLERAGMRLREIPIVFTNRRAGTSNMSLREIMESARAILRLRSRTLDLHLSQFLKFGTVGVSAALLDLSLLTVAVEVLKLPLLSAIILADGITVTYVFLLNKWWTFRDERPRYVSQYVSFLLVYASSFLLGVSLTWILAVVVGLWYVLAKILAIPLCAVWNYCWLHFRVFSRR
jgi:dolichol-phosphate mannosyltransferase